MAFIDLIFPKKCLGCGRSGRYLCSLCLQKYQDVRQICPMCSKPSIDGMTHVRCIKPQGLDGVVFVWPYGGVVRKSLLRLKYKFASDIAKELSMQIKNNLSKRTTVLSEKAVLVPIPLHKKRENWRGFNQVELIGKVVAKKMEWDFNHNLLIRKIFRKPQTKLRGKEREQNVKGVFSIDKNHLTNQSINQSLIIFDDVWTTGATLREAGKVLKRNGFKKVWGLTIAH